MAKYLLLKTFRIFITYL